MAADLAAHPATAYFATAAALEMYRTQDREDDVDRVRRLLDGPSGPRW